jgi:pSer/pThr/pTyr-binding forkhead associated (FHA) protein
MGEAGPLLTEEVVDTGAVRFHRVAEGTLQLLPGRLEILAGADSREEIRFVKLAGREPSFTFGRSPGEPHVHVQLQSPTVSRLHARMRCHEGRWLLSNLSRTNPVIVNGTAVSNGSEQRLQDGDRVEMGEIVFQFRSR